MFRIYIVVPVCWQAFAPGATHYVENISWCLAPASSPASSPRLLSHSHVTTRHTG